MLKRFDDLANAQKSNRALIKLVKIEATDSIQQELLVSLANEVQRTAFDAGYRLALQDGPLREDMGR